MDEIAANLILKIQRQTGYVSAEPCVKVVVVHREKRRHIRFHVLTIQRVMQITKDLMAIFRFNTVCLLQLIQHLDQIEKRFIDFRIRTRLVQKRTVGKAKPFAKEQREKIEE